MHGFLNTVRRFALAAIRHSMEKTGIDLVKAQMFWLVKELFHRTANKVGEATSSTITVPYKFVALTEHLF